MALRARRKLARAKPLTPGQARHGRLRRQAAADALYHAEVRAYTARRVREGAPPKQVAKELGVSRAVVEQSLHASLSRIANYDRQQRGERRPDDPPLHGEVLDSPDERAFVLQAYALRKRALPIDEIADLTGRTERQVRDAVARRLKELDQDEMSEASQAKRMMLEQIDAMMAAIITPATGKDIDGTNAPVVLEAIDRMVKLMEQKSKLLGLSAPQKIDLTSRIEILARTSGYDLEELRAITAEVLSEYSPQRLRGS